MCVSLYCYQYLNEGKNTNKNTSLKKKIIRDLTDFYIFIYNLQYIIIKQIIYNIRFDLFTRLTPVDHSELRKYEKYLI